MAIPFKRPTPKHRFEAAKEKAAITRLFGEREVPESRPGRLLLATWNIANLGAQKRTADALEVIAHILRRFDLIAVQEVNDNYKTFESVIQEAGSSFGYIMTDTAGNEERLAYVYRKDKVRPRSLFGELALRPSSYPKHTVRVRWRGKDKKEHVDVFPSHRFVPFDRNPYIGSFACGAIDFTLANVHLYFGEFQDSKTRELRKKYARRVLEIFALSKWAGSRLGEKKTTYDKDIVLLGDMNVPAMDPEESTYKALIKFGWKPVEYVSRTAGSNLGNDKTYDQMAFAPGSIGRRITAQGVFDFDNALFRPLWERLEETLPKSRAIGLFNRHVKHHISDHRPLWVELDVE
ncbi:MAG: endonuclease/exonuclease/phosphatase family protein [bacterium]|nr:endonuclease/exonuclease/phosphatase family protein [bacterium]